MDPLSRNKQTVAANSFFCFVDTSPPVIRRNNDAHAGSSPVSVQPAVPQHVCCTSIADASNVSSNSHRHSGGKPYLRAFMNANQESFLEAWHKTLSGAIEIDYVDLRGPDLKWITCPAGPLV